MMGREAKDLGMESLYEPRAEPMRVAVMMSGSGTNAERIIEYARTSAKPSYEPLVLFTENPESEAENIGERHQVPVVVNDRRKFFSQWSAKGMEARLSFDESAAKIFREQRIDIVALAGYNWFVTERIFRSFLTLNIHPGDLRPLTEKGERRYAGGIGHVPIMNAIMNGEDDLRSTVHVVNEIPDGGDILMVSTPAPVQLPEGMDREALATYGNRVIFEDLARTHQQRLKEQGDWKIFPKVLELIAEGRYRRNEEDSLYLDDMYIPYGIEYGNVI